MDGEHTRHVNSQTTRQRTTCQPARQKKKTTTDCGSSGEENFLGSGLTGSLGERNLSGI